MNIGSVSQSTSMYSVGQAVNFSKDQMEALIAGSQQIKQAPMNQKMVNTVNTAVANAHIDIYG